MKKAFRKGVRVCSAVAMLFCCPQLHAAEAKEIKTYEIPTILVIGQLDDQVETNNNYRVVDGESVFFDSANSTLSDLTFIDSSVRYSGSERRNGQELNIRGFGSKNVITAIDGVKTHFYSQHDGAVFVDPAMLRSVSLYKGAASHVYGSGGVAGYASFNTISFDDLSFDEKGNSGFANIFYQSAASDRGGVFGYGKKFDDSRVMFAVSGRNSSDIDLSDGNSLTADDNLRSGLFKFEHNFADHHQILFSHYHYALDATESNNPQISDTVAEMTNSSAMKQLSQNTDKKIISHQTSLTHKYFNDIGWNTTTTVYFQNSSVKKTELTANGIDPIGTFKKREIKSYGFDFLGEYQPWFIGFEHNHDIQKGSKHNLMNALTPSGKSDSTGLYVGRNFMSELNDDWTVNFIPIVRYDYFDFVSENRNRNYDKLSYSAKVELDHGDSTTYYVSIAKSFRAPNITELFAEGYHFPVMSLTNTFQPNPALVPETALSYELGFSHKKEGLFFDNDKDIFKASIFTSDYSNYIDQQVSGNNVGSPACPYPFVAGGCSAGITEFKNVPNARVKGFEIDNKYLYENWGWTVSLAKSFGKNTDTDVRLGNKIPLTLGNELQYMHGKWLFGLQSKSASSFLEGLKGDRIKGYTVYNVAAQYQFANNLIFQAKVDNLFDKAYVNTYSNVFSKGRDLQLQMKYTW